MNIIFMGTPEIAYESMKKLAEVHNILAVFTQPDKPNQRGNKIKFSPVKEFALEKNIPVYQPVKMREPEVAEIIRRLNPDLTVVVAYGKILPREIIDIPKHGTINLHASLLPKYRGASPIHAAVLNGDKKTGVTIMFIDEKLDEGDMVMQYEVDIEETDTTGMVYDKLSDKGAKLLLIAMEQIEKGNAVRTPQNHAESTFTKPIHKEECEINWNRTKEELYNFVRGLNPFPVAYGTIQGKRYKIYETQKIDKDYTGIRCGEIAEIIKDAGPVIKVENGGLLIKQAKPENKGMLSGVDLINGGYVKL